MYAVIRNGYNKRYDNYLEVYLETIIKQSVSQYLEPVHLVYLP